MYRGTRPQRFPTKTAAQPVMRQKTITCFDSRFEIGKAAKNLIDVVTEP